MKKYLSIYYRPQQLARCRIACEIIGTGLLPGHGDASQDDREGVSGWRAGVTAEWRAHLPHVPAESYSKKELHMHGHRR
jgi:hypothetical protein